MVFLGLIQENHQQGYDQLLWLAKAPGDSGLIFILADADSTKVENG